MAPKPRVLHQRRLHIIGDTDDHPHGVTTALIDMALTNGRRGEQVVYLARDPEEAQRVYRRAADTLHDQRDTVAEFEPRNRRVRWPDTLGQRGSVKFACPQEELHLRGYRASVFLLDGCRSSIPEVVHAHTVIMGG